jgi:hypothetical protein
MGFALSILYFVTYYLTPDTLFGPLAAYRIELIIAVLALLASIPELAESFVFKTPQSLALAGLAFAVFLSIVFGMHWIGGAMPAFLLFIPNALAYFLVCLHCNSVKRLRILVLMLVFVCLFVIANGIFELQHIPPAGSAAYGDSPPSGLEQAPYVLPMTNSANQWFYRLRGLGEINDPNDFAQLIICVLPLVFIFWKPKRPFRNTILVLLPVCALLYGAYLTHSRGAIMALLAVFIVAMRRRIGTVPSILLAVGLFATASALHISGGRDISINAGEDRTVLWGEGLQLLKSHPLFGVGFGGMPEYVGHTAHNSLVVCAAELGMFGLYFWSLFLFPTARDILVVSSPANVSEEILIEPEAKPFIYSMARSVESVDKEELCRLGRLVFLSLTGFVVAGWFLSRAFVVTLFLLGGIVEVTFQMALRRNMIGPRMPLLRVSWYSGVMAVLLILTMYIMLRTVNLMH